MVCRLYFYYHRHLAPYRAKHLFKRRNNILTLFKEIRLCLLKSHFFYVKICAAGSLKTGVMNNRQLFILCQMYIQLNAEFLCNSSSECCHGILCHIRLMMKAPVSIAPSEQLIKHLFLFHFNTSFFLISRLSSHQRRKLQVYS